MSGLATAPPRLSDEAVLRGCIEDQVTPRILGRRCSVRSIEKESSPEAGSYRSYAVRAELADGRTLRLFLKDYGWSSRPRRDLKARRERELGVYRDLISPASLATPRFLGAVWEGGSGRHWLILELIDGSALRDLEPQHWIPPLTWLGRLHSRFAGAWDGISPPEVLERHDHHFFRRKADRALAVLFSRSPRLARRMAVVRERFELVLPVLTSKPHTLVHGAFVPANVIVATGERQRICAVDWELAAVGSPLYDLAFFCDGFQPPVLDRMLAAYRRGIEGRALALPAEDGIVHAINCFRLYRVMDWLTPAADKSYPDEALERLVKRGETLCRLVTG